MATLTDITEAVHDALVTVVGDATSVDTPADHVGLATRQQDATYPFVAFNVIPRSERAGIGNEDVYVDSVTTDQSNVLQSITYATDFTARVPIVVSDADDDALTRDTLREAIRSWVTVRNAYGDPSDVHVDIDTIRLQTDGADVGGADTRQSDMTLTISYSRYQTYDDIPAMETILFDLDAEADIDTTQSVDVVDQTIS